MTARDLLRHVAVNARLAVMIALAILAASAVASLTVDLGPGVKSRLEVFLTTGFVKPVTIGALSVRLLDGQFVIRDLTLAGTDSRSEPFLRAREIRVAMPLAALLRRQIRIASVEMVDWKVRLE